MRPLKETNQGSKQSVIIPYRKRACPASCIFLIIVLLVFYVSELTQISETVKNIKDSSLLLQADDNDESNSNVAEDYSQTVATTMGSTSSSYVTMNDPAMEEKSATKTKGKVNQIALLGERNSGTRWMFDHLTDCFDTVIPVSERLVRHKHWFQHDVVESARIQNTLVVAQFRNPYHWVESMRLTNHHSPMHYRTDWESYVTTPWTMQRLSYDLELVEAYNKEHPGKATNYSDIPCQDFFKYDQINSCLKKPYLKGKFANKEREKDGMSGHEPMYELRDDGSGRPYSTVLEMRSDKILNFLEIAKWNWITDVLPVQYENMVEQGTENLIRRIEEITGVKATCQYKEAQTRPAKGLPQNYVNWMTKYVNWETEALLGYKKCDRVESCKP